jgi:hypothetical protein
MGILAMNILIWAFFLLFHHRISVAILRMDAYYSSVFPFLCIFCFDNFYSFFSLLLFKIYYN